MIKGISIEFLLCIVQTTNQILLSVYYCTNIIHTGRFREVSIYGYPKCFICKNYKWKIWHLVRNVDLLLHKFAPLIFMYFLNCALLLSILLWSRLTINIWITAVQQSKLLTTVGEVTTVICWGHKKQDKMGEIQSIIA